MRYSSACPIIPTLVVLSASCSRANYYAHAYSSKSFIVVNDVTYSHAAIGGRTWPIITSNQESPSHCTGQPVAVDATAPVTKQIINHALHRLLVVQRRRRVEALAEANPPASLASPLVPARRLRGGHLALAGFPRQPDSVAAHWLLQRPGHLEGYRRSRPATTRARSKYEEPADGPSSCLMGRSSSIRRHRFSPKGGPVPRRFRLLPAAGQYWNTQTAPARLSDKPDPNVMAEIERSDRIANISCRQGHAGRLRRPRWGLCRPQLFARAGSTSRLVGDPASRARVRASQLENGRQVKLGHCPTVGPSTLNCPRDWRRLRAAGARVVGRRGGARLPRRLGSRLRRGARARKPPPRTCGIVQSPRQAGVCDDEKPFHTSP